MDDGYYTEVTMISSSCEDYEKLELMELELTREIRERQLEDRPKGPMKLQRKNQPRCPAYWSGSDRRWG